ncbi:MAG: UDP-N-acetylglucosamine 2-epimerase (non-hydrolyzing) [Acidaminococcaceae bacterium]
MKLITIVGARPQFVKAAVVARAIAKHNQVNEQKIEEIIIHTNQHYDLNMSAVFFEEMHIPRPNYNLGVGGGAQGAMTGRMLEKIEEILLAEQPDYVLVYGDTNSTLAGALAAVKLHIPVVHIEAGLRSFNMSMPEEVNRILTDRVATLLLCPTQTAVTNLQVENIKQGVHNVGDVMYDAVEYYGRLAQPSLEVKQLCTHNYCLATVHRAENTDDVRRLANIMRALDTIATDKTVVLPLHPRTKKILQAHNIKLKNVTLIEPVGYFDILTLLKNAEGVFTDSGGMQKEAYFFAKPCFTLRDETEWVELVEGGANKLVGADYETIMQTYKTWRPAAEVFATKLYGNGDAGEKIVALLGKMM